MIRRIRLMNPPEEQALALGAFAYPKKLYQGALAGLQSKIFMRLKNLISQRALKHTIKLEIPDGWSAPQDINLG